MRAALRSIVMVTALLGMNACASGAPQAESAPSAAPRRSRDVLTREELLESHFDVVYDGVAAMRPLWLQSRRSEQNMSMVPVIVYMDQTRLGDVETLKRISARLVTTVRHLDGPDATARYGVGHISGVIVVTTEAPGRPGRDSVAVTPP